MSRYDSDGEIPVKKIVAAVILVIIIITSVILVIAAFVSVPAGCKGVVVGGPGEMGTQYDEGWTMTNPFVTIDIVRWSTQALEEDVNVLTNDQMLIPVDFQVTYHLQEDKVGYIHITTPEYKDTIVRNLLRSEVRKVASDMNLTGEMVNTHRSLFEASVSARVTAEMLKYFIIAESVNIRNVEMPYIITNAAEMRAAAKIDIETASYELAAEQARAMKEQVRAMAEANATVILADGQAESIEILTNVSGDMSPEMMNYILSLRYIAALRDPNCNVAFVIVPMDGTPLILNMDELMNAANSTSDEGGDF